MVLGGVEKTWWVGGWVGGGGDSGGMSASE